MKHDCISCLVREHLHEKLLHLDSLASWTQVLVTFPPAVEASAFPQLLEIFQEQDSSDFVLLMDASIVVIDALLLLEQMEDASLIRDWDLKVTPGDQRAVGEILARYIEFSDEIIITNSHRMSSEKLEATIQFIVELNPEAHMIPMDTHAERIALGNFHHFNINHPRRQSPLCSNWESTLRTEDQQVNHVRWQADRPMHPVRFSEILDNRLADVLRSRGQLWMANHVTHQISWESVGELCSLSITQQWSEMDSPAENFLYLVGYRLDPAAIRDALNSCLLSQSEMDAGLDSWKDIQDPFADALSTQSIGEGES
jgi:G3E family GTPase